MASQTKFAQIAEADFASLLQALSATPKGRAFLAEYRRRGRPEETLGLLEALQRIETAVASVRDQLQPERIADELRRIAMTLDIAVDGANADPEGDETARRMALVGRAVSELSALAASLASEVAPTPVEDDGDEPTEAEPLDDPGEPDVIENDLPFLDQLEEDRPDASAER